MVEFSVACIIKEMIKNLMKMMMVEKFLFFKVVKERRY